MRLRLLACFLMTFAAEKADKNTIFGTIKEKKSH